MAGDTILIAGKGHETYQEVNGEQIPFDDYLISEGMLHKLTSIASV